MTNDVIVEATGGSDVWETARMAYDEFTRVTSGRILIRHNCTIYEVKLQITPIGQMEMMELKKGVSSE